MGHYDDCYAWTEAHDNDEYRRSVKLKIEAEKKEAKEKYIQMIADRKEFEERMRRILVH